MQDLKQQFLKIYSTLPLGVRREIVAVFEPPTGPVTWEVAYIEIEHNTPLGAVILQRLEKMQII
ncbi:MAG: hypothetical protein AAB386_02625 [Patescibacteria group bacterium]